MPRNKTAHTHPPPRICRYKILFFFRFFYIFIWRSFSAVVIRATATYFAKLCAREHVYYDAAVAVPPHMSHKVVKITRRSACHVRLRAVGVVVVKKYLLFNRQYKTEKCDSRTHEKEIFSFGAA